MALRRRQLRNAMCLLLLSHGTPMFVAGDEFARTQGGNNNAYNQDNETSAGSTGIGAPSSPITSGSSPV
jgi:isoamylase